MNWFGWLGWQIPGPIVAALWLYSLYRVIVSGYVLRAWDRASDYRGAVGT